MVLGLETVWGRGWERVRGFLGWGGDTGGVKSKEIKAPINANTRSTLHHHHQRAQTRTDAYRRVQTRIDAHRRMPLDVAALGIGRKRSASFPDAASPPAKHPRTVVATATATAGAPHAPPAPPAPPPLPFPRPPPLLTPLCDLQPQSPPLPPVPPRSTPSTGFSQPRSSSTPQPPPQPLPYPLPPPVLRPDSPPRQPTASANRVAPSTSTATASGLSNSSRSAPSASTAVSALGLPIMDSAGSTGASSQDPRSFAPDAGFREAFPWSHGHRRVQEAFEEAYAKSSFGVVSDASGILNSLR